MKTPKKTPKKIPPKKMEKPKPKLKEPVVKAPNRATPSTSQTGKTKLGNFVFGGAPRPTAPPLLRQVFKSRLPAPSTSRALPSSSAQCASPPVPRSAIIRPRGLYQFKPSGEAPLALSESSTVDNSPSIEFTPFVKPTATASPPTQLPRPPSTVKTSPQMRRHKITPKSPLVSADVQELKSPNRPDTIKSADTSTTNQSIRDSLVSAMSSEIPESSTCKTIS